MVSHGQTSDPFWSVVANGAGDAAREMGVRLEYQAPTSFDMVRMSQLIDAAVASRPSALAISVPDPDALAASVKAAIAAGIPAISVNSGDAAWQRLGFLAHIGQTEYESGVAAGERLADAGAKRVLCVNHEIGNVSLDTRCRGLADGLDKQGATMQVLGVSLADPEDAAQRIRSALARDTAIDGMLMLGPGGAAPALAALRESTGWGRSPLVPSTSRPKSSPPCATASSSSPSTSSRTSRATSPSCCSPSISRPRPCPAGGSSVPAQLRDEGERGRRDRSGGARDSMRRANS